MTSPAVVGHDPIGSDDVRIRWARPADAEVVGRLFEREARYHQQLLTTFDLVEDFDWPAMVEGLIGRSGVRIVVADCDGEVVGFAYGRVVGEPEHPGVAGEPPLGLRRLARSLLGRFRSSQAPSRGGSQKVRPHPRGIIEDCWVESHHRRRGLAQRMVEALLEWMVARQVPRVELSVVAANEGAVALWRELGFEPLRHVLHRAVR